MQRRARACRRPCSCNLHVRTVVCPFPCKTVRSVRNEAPRADDGIEDKEIAETTAVVDRGRRWQRMCWLLGAHRVVVRRGSYGRAIGLGRLEAKRCIGACYEYRRLAG